MMKQTTSDMNDQPKLIVWVMAFITEARPLIRHFAMKKDLQATPFPVYHTQGQLLIICGLGKVRAAMAVSWVIARYSADQIAGMINVGLCGTSDLSLQTGDMIMASQVRDADQNRYFYPDLYLAEKLKLPLRTLACWSSPVYAGQSGLEQDASDTCYDMESAGIMEATRLFLQTHQVLILKIISDYLQPDKVRQEINSAASTDWVNRHLPILTTAGDALKNLDAQTMVPLLADINSFMSAASGEVKLTAAMQQQLFDKTRQLMLAKADVMPELAETILAKLILTRNPIRHKLNEKKTFQTLLEIMDEAIKGKVINA